MEQQIMEEISTGCHRMGIMYILLKVYQLKYHMI